MATVQREVLTTGEVIRGAFAVLRDNVRTVLVYLGALLAAGIVVELNPYSDFDGVTGLAWLAVFFVAQYFLFEAMLRQAGLLVVDRRRRVLGFVGQAFVVLFGVLFAANFFVIPAFIVGARWILAPSLLVSGRCGAMSALSESWAETRGNTPPIAFAAAALMFVGYAVGLVVDGAGGAVAKLVGASDILGTMLLIGVNLALVCLSVAVFQRLNKETHELAEVFA